MNKSFTSMNNFFGDGDKGKIQCPVCGEMFKPAPEHIYHIGKNKENYCCTYTCMRNWQKSKQAVPVTRKLKYGTSVRIAETGEVFPSINQCAERLEANYGIVYRALMNGYACKGYHIEAVEEGDAE